MNIKHALSGLLVSGLVVAGLAGAQDQDQEPPPPADGGNPVQIKTDKWLTPTGAEVIRETTVELEWEAEEPAGVDDEELRESKAYLRSYGLTGQINIRGTIHNF